MNNHDITKEEKINWRKQADDAIRLDIVPEYMERILRLLDALDMVERELDRLVELLGYYQCDGYNHGFIGPHRKDL